MVRPRRQAARQRGRSGELLYGRSVAGFAARRGDRARRQEPRGPRFASTISSAASDPGSRSANRARTSRPGRRTDNRSHMAIPGSGVRVKAADGSSESKLILAEKTNIWPLSWSADGKRMLLRIQDNQRRRRRALGSASGGRNEAASALPDGSGRARERLDLAGREVAPLRLERNRAPRGLRRALPVARREAAGVDGGRRLRNMARRQGDRLRAAARRPALRGRRRHRGRGTAPRRASTDLRRQAASARSRSTRRATESGSSSRSRTRDAASAQIRFVSDWRADLVKK